MATLTTTNAELTSIANAIRAKNGTSLSLAYPAEFISAIEDIPVTCEALSLTGVLISGENYRLESEAN